MGFKAPDALRWQNGFSKRLKETFKLFNCFIALLFKGRIGYK